MAEFYKGFTFECDVKGRLTIEGNPVQVVAAPDDGVDLGCSADDGTRVALARAYIDSSVELRARERERAEHLRILRSGKAAWNQWRREHPEVHPMLAGHDFTECDGDVVLDGFDFSYTNFTQASLRGISLRGANFHQAILAKADLVGAHLEESNFCRTDFYETNFERAWLTGANLQGVQLARTNLTGAHLRACRVYGLSAWDLKLDGADQGDLRIRYEELVGGQRIERNATIDGIDVASFMYFTLNNSNIARIIGATTSQWVLLLGSFTVHKEVLDELAKALKQRNCIPVVLDFERATQRDLVESIILLAGLSRLVIVDISDPRSTPLELQAIVPNFSVSVVPIMKAGTRPFGVFSGLLKFPWVRPLIEYENPTQLVGQLDVLLAATSSDDAETSRRLRHTQTSVEAET
jgi:Pentapeptide repeats (8 copies)